MGTRFRRSFKVAPGVRVNLNKKSASISFGPKGLKHTVSTTGMVSTPTASSTRWSSPSTATPRRSGSRTSARRGRCWRSR